MYLSLATLPETAVTCRTLSQEDVDNFAACMDGGGRVHVDRDWATAQFGGTIVHGFLVFSGAAQVAASVFGARWYSHGTIRVRFLKRTLSGSEVTTTCRLRANAPDDAGAAVYDVECRLTDGTLAASGELSCPVHPTNDKGDAS